jgi:hypothetical protein
MYPDGIAGRNTSSAEMYTNVLGVSTADLSVTGEVVVERKVLQTVMAECASISDLEQTYARTSISIHVPIASLRFFIQWVFSL